MKQFSATKSSVMENEVASRYFMRKIFSFIYRKKKEVDEGKEIAQLDFQICKILFYHRCVMQYCYFLNGIYVKKEDGTIANSFVLHKTTLSTSLRIKI